MARAGRAEDAVAAFYEAQVSGVELDKFAYTAVIRACEKAMWWEMALDLLFQMEGEHVQGDTFVYNSVIGACAKGARQAGKRGRGAGRLARDQGGPWALALGLLGDMAAARVTPNAITFSSMISALKEAEQWELALGVLDSMAEAAVSPDTIIYSGAISACAKGGAWVKATELLGLMSEQRVAADTIVYNAVLSACEKGGQWEVATHLLGEMADVHVRKDTYTYSTAVSAFAKGGLWEGALSLLEVMAAEKVRADTFTYTAAISACESAGRWTTALALFDTMRQRGMSRNTVTYSSLISVLSKGGQWDAALDLLGAMATARVERNTITYSAAISACERSGRWESALVVFAEMAGAKVRRNTITYNAVISACEHAEQWERCLGLLHGMRQDSVDADLTTYKAVALACACAPRESWRRVLRIFDMMAFRSISLDEDLVSLGLMECEQEQQLREERALLDAFRDGHPSDASLGLGQGIEIAYVSRLVKLGRHADAADLLREAATRGEWTKACKALWGVCGAGYAPPPMSWSGGGVVLRQAGDAVEALSAVGWSRATKELSLLMYVLDTAEAGNAASVLGAVDRFGEEIWGAHGVWCTSACGTKGLALAAAVCAAAPSGRILEIGAYCGYSAITMAMACPDSHITTMEVNPSHMVVARSLVALAGLVERIDVWTGHSKHLLQRLGRNGRGGGPQAAPFVSVFMDRWGSQYMEDFDALERCGLLQDEAIIVADNLLRTGATAYLWRVLQDDAFETLIVPVVEYATQTEDWLSVSVRRAGWAAREASSTPDIPKRLQELHEASEKLRMRVIMPSEVVTAEERAAFADEVRAGLEDLGVRAAAT